MNSKIAHRAIQAKRSLTLSLIACGLLGAQQPSPVANQSASSTIPSALKVLAVNVGHQPDEKNSGFQITTVTFTLLNTSALPVVAYAVQVVGTRADGTNKKIYDVDFERTFGIGWTGSQLPKGTFPLAPGESTIHTFTVRANDRLTPISVSVVPVYAVLMDRTVTGDATRAIDQFFNLQAACAVVYSQHLAELAGVDTSSGTKILTALGAFYKEYQAPGPVGVDSRTSHAVGLARANIAGALQAAYNMNLHTNTPNGPQMNPALRDAVAAQLLAKHKAEIQRRLDNALKFSSAN